VKAFAGYLVHAYTATGVVWGFLSLRATLEGDYRAALLWLLLATLVDATDGALARLVDVARTAALIDGARLDDIVDYLTFVFLPALLLYHSGALPHGWDALVVSCMLLSSAYGFASSDAKTDDHFFTGFPSYWNIVALYLHAARVPPAINAAILLVLSALVFVRIGYVYPSRTPTLRPLTLALGAIWAVLMVALIFTLPDVPGVLFAASLVFPVYYTGLSFALQARRARAPLRT
jgi:phosphatidylcholine synthase